MTEKDRASLQAELPVFYPDNSTGFITPAKLRSQQINMIDSLFNLIDDSLENVTLINDRCDFPNEPDGSGFIEIGGGVKTYLIQAGDVDLGSFKLKQTGGVVVIRGSNRFTSQLISTTTSPLITVVDGFYADEFMNFSNPNGPIYDYDGGGLAGGAFVSQNGIIRDCTTIGTIKDASTISLRTSSVATTSVGGLMIEGTDLFQLNISLMLGFEWAGTLIDLGTSTWDIINFTSGSRWISPAGTKILSGLSGSGNLTATGRGLVDGNLFNGLGAALTGIETTDIQWDFGSNIFADNTTKNTLVAADTFLTASRTVTIGGGNQGTYFPINGSDWNTDQESRFTATTAGILTYIGLETIEAEIISTATVEKSGGGSDKICVKIALDTGSGFVVQDKTISCTQNANPTGVTSIGFFSISTGNKMQLFTANVDGTSNVIVSEATMQVKKIV